MGNEQYRADLAKRRGKLAAAITDPDQRKRFVAAQGQAEAAGTPLDNIEAETSRMTNNQALGLTSYKKGGRVKKTGPAMLHKGEYVVPEHEVHAYSFRNQKGRRAPLMMKRGK